MSKTPFEDALGLPSIDDAIKDISDEEVKSKLKQHEPVSSIKSRLHDVGDLNEPELDELKNKALEAHKDLLDLGMNVPPGQSESFLSVSKEYLSIAVTLEQEKIANSFKFEKLKNERTKMDIELAKLELLKKKMEMEEMKKLSTTGSELIDNSSSDFVGTRNELLEFMEKMKK